MTATPDARTTGTIEYQWYSSIGGTTTKIPTATAATYTVPTTSAFAATKFWATVTKSSSCSGESDSSNHVTIVVNPMPSTPAITINPNQTTFCEGEAYDLTAASTVSAGTVNYTWSNAVTGSTAQVNGLTTAGSHTYKVVAEASGCKDSLEQVITVNPNDSAEFTVDDISTCANVGDIDLSTYLTAGTTAGGTYAGTNMTGSNFSTAIAGGTYKVVYTTGGSCPEKDSLEMKVEDKVTAQIETTDTTVCFGSASFTVRLTAGSATDGVWSGSGITAGTFDPSGLAAGDYQIKYVKQGLSAACSDSDSVTVTIQALDSALIAKPLPSMCNSDPAVQLNLGSGATTGGTWADSLSATTYVNASGMFDPAGLVDGQYKVVYTTPNTCAGKDSGYVTVTSNITYLIQATQQTTYCKNYGLDTLDVDVAGGEIWTKSGNGVVSKSERIFNTNLMAVGTDTLWYGKAGTCGDTIAYEITINPIDTAVIDSISPLCEDTTAVSLTITGSATGGTWAGAGVSGDQFTASTAGVGVHMITYTTAGSCPIIDTAWIEVKERKDATIKADTTAFCGSAIAATMSSAQSGGTWSGWTGKWSTQGSDTLILFDPNANTNSGTEDMIYTIADQWCPDADTVSVSITAMEVAEIDSNAAVCIDGGMVPFTLSALSTAGGAWEGTGIDATTGVFDPTVSGAGTHEIKYQTPGGCFARDSVSIVVRPRADATLDKDSIKICEGVGVQTATGADMGGVWRGQTGAYTSEVDNVLSFDPTISGDGTFEIYYNIDQSGAVCGDSDTVIVLVTANDIADIGSDTIFCQADTPRDLVLVAGSTPGGTWSGTGITDASLGTFDPSTAGLGVGSNNQNTVTYTTNGICQVSDQATIEIVSAIDVAIDLANSDTVFCANASSAFVVQTGTTGGQWVSDPVGFVNTSTGELDLTAMAADAGNTLYEIKYFAGPGGACYDADSVVVRKIPVLDPTIGGVPTAALCLTSDLPLTSLTATGDAGGVWGSNAGTVDASTGEFTATAGGTYTITYSLGAGTPCPIDSSVQISVVAPIDPSITPAGPFCENLGGQQLETAVSGGTWGGAGVSSTGVFDPSNLGAGTHTVTYTQSNGCDTTGTIDILVQGIPVIDVEPDVTEGCEPLKVLFTDKSSSEAVKTTWLFEDGTTANTLDTASKTFMGGSCYGLTVTQEFDNQCIATQSFTGLVCVDALPSPDFEWEPTRPSVMDPNITFKNLSQGADSYLWTFGRLATPSQSAETNPYVNFDSDNGDTIEVCLTASNGACSLPICKDVVILNNVSIYIPTSFTPNGDGLNDFFYPNGKFHDNAEGLDQFEFAVFNRWGERIFNSTTPYYPWDGTYKNKIVQSDVYVWKITVWDPVKQTPKTEIGTVTVIH